MKKKVNFYLGISIIILLIISYFIKFTVEEGSNYALESSLLGAVIFYNPFILGIYLLIALVFIFNP